MRLYPHLCTTHFHIFNQNQGQCFPSARVTHAAAIFDVGAVPTGHAPLCAAAASGTAWVPARWSSETKIKKFFVDWFLWAWGCGVTLCFRLRLGILHGGKADFHPVPVSALRPHEKPSHLKQGCGRGLVLQKSNKGTKTPLPPRGRWRDRTCAADARSKSQSPQPNPPPSSKG